MSFKDNSGKATTQVIYDVGSIDYNKDENVKYYVNFNKKRRKGELEIN